MTLRLFLIFACLVLAGGVASATTTYTITVNVTEDGEDYLLLNGSTLEWEHLATGSDLFANGGVTGGDVTETNFLGDTQTVDNPYIEVSGTDSSNSGANFTNSDWYNGIQGFQCGGTTSNSAKTIVCPYTDSLSQFEFALPVPFTLTGITGNVALIIISCEGTSGSCGGGGSLSILDQPATNAGTLEVDLNDAPDSGTNNFDFTLTWTDTNTVPEPATLGIVGLGLVALGFARKKWKRQR